MVAETVRDFLFLGNGGLGFFLQDVEVVTRILGRVGFPKSPPSVCFFFF